MKTTNKTCQGLCKVKAICIMILTNGLLVSGNALKRLIYYSQRPIKKEIDPSLLIMQILLHSLSTMLLNQVLTGSLHISELVHLMVFTRQQTRSSTCTLMMIRPIIKLMAVKSICRLMSWWNANGLVFRWHCKCTR